MPATTELMMRYILQPLFQLIAYLILTVLFVVFVVVFVASMPFLIMGISAFAMAAGAWDDFKRLRDYLRRKGAVK